MARNKRGEGGLRDWDLGGFSNNTCVDMPPPLSIPRCRVRQDTSLASIAISQINKVQFKIALCQLLVTSDKERNIAHARKTIEHAAQNGAKLEIWICPHSNDNFLKYGEEIDSDDVSPSLSTLSEVARAEEITIVGGSMLERNGGRLYNTCCVFGTYGKLKAKHRKLHLFDVNIPRDFTFKESDILTAGDEATVVDTDVGCIGIEICHDICFPELAMLYVARGQLIINCLWPLAHPLENRDMNAGHIAWGHSTLVGPFGEIIASTGHEATVFAEIDYSLIQFRRESLPLEKQRCGDIYQLIDVHGLKVWNSKQ